MSRKLIITSEKEINLNKVGIDKITLNQYLLEHYPCLRGKKFIYDFDGFDNSISYKELINKLVKFVNKENVIIFLVLEQTDNIDEINLFNKKMQKTEIINLSENQDKLYELIYRLERDSLQSSTEYKLINE